MNQFLLRLPKWLRDALGIKITVAKITRPITTIADNLEAHATELQHLANKRTETAARQLSKAEVERKAGKEAAGVAERYRKTFLEV